MRNNLIGRNIKTLRKIYGESQTELSLVIDTGKTTISHYENGKRIPDNDVLKKIAAHYWINLDELVNKEISSVNFTSIPFEDLGKMMRISREILPIICTDEALADPLFRKGYEKHIRITENIDDNEIRREEDIDICFQAYEESVEKNNTLESRANLIWWLLNSGLIYKNEQIFDGMDELQRNRISKHDFIKDYYLYNVDYYNDLPNDQEKDELKFIIMIDEEIISLVKALKRSSKWSDLADYYIALRYILGIVNNENDDGTNRMIGLEMLYTFSMLGNKYANKLIRASLKLVNG